MVQNGGHGFHRHFYAQHFVDAVGAHIHFIGKRQFAQSLSHCTDLAATNAVYQEGCALNGIGL